ncbi:MAG: lysylphosphatidylglycerol synthase transmembrane domain-containing protein [Candidatus Hodarchaeales archaeon]|jgi:uncharacterized membrane protein YbhN (UPF0104 family)
MEKQSNPDLHQRNISLKEVFDKKTLMLLGFAAFVLILYFILEDVSISSIIDTFLGANMIILVMGAAFTFIAVLFDTITWKLLLGISRITPSIQTTYRIQLSSFSYGLLIPSAGAVEAIMKVVMGTQEFYNEEEKRHATSGEVLSSVVAHKLCGLLAFIPISTFIAVSMFEYLSSILVELGYAPLPADFNFIFVVLISIITILIVSLFVLIALKPNTAKSTLNTFLKGFGSLPLIKNRIDSTRLSSDKIVDDFSIQFTYLAKNKFISLMALILAFFAQVAHWLSILLILHSVDIWILLDQVAAVNFLGGTVDLIPVGIPGMAGLKEISLSVFIEYGLSISTDKALSGAILVQLVKFYFLIMVGLIVYVLGKTRVTSQDFEDSRSSIP